MMSFKKFIDFDKRNNNFYDNVYINEENIVVKIPFASKEHSENGNVKKRQPEHIKLEHFDLSKYTYLTSYE